MYNIGDIFIINDQQYTIWLVDNGIYHLINQNNHGICCDEDYLTTLSI